MELSLKPTEDDSIRVCVYGRITQQPLGSEDSDPIEELLGQDAYSRDILLDMRSADFMDSSGVNWLIGSNKRFQENGHRMIVHSVPPVIRNVIRVMRLDLLIELAEDEAEALNKIQHEKS